MKLAIVLLVGFHSLAPALPAQSKEPFRLEAKVDARVELVSIVCRLAGFQEYQQCRVPSYSTNVDATFSAFKEHPVFALAHEIRDKHSIYYDGWMSLAVHLPLWETWASAQPFQVRQASLNQELPLATLQEFFLELKDFAETSHFQNFFNSHKDKYAQVCSRLQTHLDTGQISLLDSYYGALPNSQFSLFIGMINGGGNYGPDVIHANGVNELFCILGAPTVDEKGDPMYTPDILATVAHEFSHSYVNDVILADFAPFEASGERLFPLVKDQRSMVSYTTWDIIVCESVVRAAVVRYMEHTQGKDAAAIELADQLERSFLWTAELVKVFELYEADRTQYPNLKSLLPKIVQCFNEFQPAPGDAQK